eukprot:3255722-Rhodomonas_salina.2
MRVRVDSLTGESEDWRGGSCDWVRGSGATGGVCDTLGESVLCPAGECVTGSVGPLRPSLLQCPGLETLTTWPGGYRLRDLSNELRPFSSLDPQQPYTDLLPM